MNKTLRFIISAVLVVSLVFSGLVFANAAAVTDVYDEASFFTAISDKASVINVTQGFTISSSTSPEINFNTTIKGNGNKIILGARIIFSSGISTVDNLHVERANGNDCYFMQNSAAVTIYGGSMRQFSTSGDNTCICIDETFDGVVNVTGGAQMTACRYLIVSDSKGTTKGGTINLLNCTLNGTTNGNDSIKLRSGQTLNIGNNANGEKTVLNLTGDGIYMNDTASSVVNVYDGAVINCANHFSNLNASGNPTINVYGGTITCANRLLMSQQKATINVYGGTLKSTSTEDGRIFALRKGSSAVVMGGTFTNGASAPLDPDESSSLKIAGGSFNFDPSAYIAGNYASSNSNGTYNVALSLGTPTTVSTADALATAVANKAPYIKITAPIALSDAIDLTYDAYIDGGNNLLTENQIKASGNSVVTLKDVNIERTSDTTRFTENAHITISGGTYNCTGTSFNNGALYVADTYTGRIVVTDDALIKADTVLPFYTGANSNCAGGMVEFIDCTVTGGGEKGTLYIRSNMAITIGGGTDGQEANISNTKYKAIFNNESGWGAVLNIKDGAVISQTTGAYAIHFNKTAILNMTGGKINSKGQGIVVDSQNSFVSVSGGTFTATNEVCIQKNNGALLVSGGNFTSTYADGPAAIYSSTRSEKAGALLIDAANITVADGTALLSHNGEFYTVISNADMEQDGTIINVLGNGGDITLNNCKLTSAGNTITSASSAAINLTNGTSIVSTGAAAIDGSATVNKDATSSATGATGGEPGGGEPGGEPGGGESGGGEPGGEPDSGEDEPLPENATLEEIIARAKAGDTITISKDYTKVPAITIDKSLTFDGVGSIAFANTGFEIAEGVNVTFNGDIKVTMGADDAGGNNRLINLNSGANLTINGGSFTGYIRTSGGSSSAYTKATINGGSFAQKNYRIFCISNGYNELVVNGGKFIGNGSEPFLRINDSTAKMTILGGEFNHSGSGAVLLVGNLKTLEIGDKTTGKGPEMTNSNSGRIIDFNTGSGIESSSATVNINAGVFTQTGSGYNIYFNKKANATININGGIFTTQSLATVYVNDSNVKDLRINGGTFETKTVGEQTIWKRNGTLTITGGKFIGNGSYGIIGSANGTNVGALTIDCTKNPDAIEIEHRGTGVFIEHNAQVELKIINANLAIVGDGNLIKIAGTSSKAITITDSNLSASNAALSIADEEWTDAKSTITVNNSTISSYLGSAVVNPKNWPINKDANSKFVDNALGNHTHTPVWTYDDVYHWQACNNPFCGVAVTERVKHTAQGGDCQHTKYCSDPNCGQPFGGNNYDIHVNPNGPFTYEENADGTTHTKYYTCCNTKAKTNEKHTFNSNGYCKYCDAYQVYGFKTVADTKQVIGEGQEITFTSVADFSKFVGVRVNGKTLVAGTDYVAVSGSTKITLKANFVKTLMVGVHTIEIISTDGTATTTFAIEVAGSENEIPFIEETTKPGSSSKPSTDKKPSDSDTSDTNDTTTPDAGNSGNGGSNNVGTSDATGDFNNLLLLFALLFVSGAAVVATLIYGKKSKVR